MSDIDLIVGELKGGFDGIKDSLTEFKTEVREDITDLRGAVKKLETAAVWKRSKDKAYSTVLGAIGGFLSTYIFK